MKKDTLEKKRTEVSPSSDEAKKRRLANFQAGINEQIDEDEKFDKEHGIPPGRFGPLVDGKLIDKNSTKDAEKSSVRSTQEKKGESVSEKLLRLTSGRLKVTKPPFKGISF